MRPQGKFELINQVKHNTTLVGLGHNLPPGVPLWDGSPLSSFFGTHDGLIGALGEKGELCRFSHESCPAFTLRGDESSPRLAHVAINNTDRVTIIFLASPAANLMHILEFSSVLGFFEWYSDPSADPPANGVYSHPSLPTDKPDSQGEIPAGLRPSLSRVSVVDRRHFMVPGRAKKLVAFATGFVLLTETGEVYTWGDARHDRCLGRSVDVSRPHATRRPRITLRPFLANTLIRH